MKHSIRFVVLVAVTFLFLSEADAVPVKIVSGEIFIGGTAYQTPRYQTYLRFYMVGQTLNPKRNYIMQAEQVDAVYLDHPIQPNGDYEYQVRMPNHGSSFTVNEETFFPVWYSACIWRIKGNVQTPEVTANSPQFMTVNSNFTFGSSSNFYGAYSTGFRVKGQGTSELLFEKLNTKYFIREARYTFTDQASLTKNSK